MTVRRCSWALLGSLGLALQAWGQLDLPRSAKSGAPVPDPAAPVSSEGPGNFARPRGSTPEDAARFVFDAVVRGAESDEGLYRQALQTLSESPAALAVAREELEGEEAARVKLAARILLELGGIEEHRAIAARLKRRVPPRIGAELLSDLLARDPTLGTPDFLVSLLDHPTGALRTAASRELALRLDPSFLSALSEVLDSPRASARSAAVEAIGRLAAGDWPAPAELVPAEAAQPVDPLPVEPLILELLLRTLADASSKVAFHAAETLARLEKPKVAARLEEVAFARAILGENPPFDRRAGYAILALVEREDREGISILAEERAPLLLEGLEDPRPLVAGAAATALAGIGYRSGATYALPWLDRDVPHALVKFASGDLFHEDFTALQGPGLRRLAWITGEEFGTNGPLWQAWWSEHAASFHARRAVLAVDRGQAGRLVIRLWSDGNEILLAGEDAEGLSDEEEERALGLSARDAGELFARFEELGLFGAERLSAGDAGTDGRVLEIEIDGARKRFELAARMTGDSALFWFDRAERAVLELAEKNRWQRFFDPARFRSARELARAEGESWEGRSPEERARALKELVFDRLAADPQGLEELVELFGQPGVAESRDFARCVALLEPEPSYGPRILTIVDLALTAAEALRAPGDGFVDPALAADLVRLLVERFGEAARPAVERVLARSGTEAARSSARDERVWLRSLAAARLALSSADEDVELALALAVDPEASVATASVDALGWNRVERARAILEEHARGGPRTSLAVRRSALVALARLGGGSARELAILALSEGEPTLQQAALEALAEIADPEDAALFASHLSRGSEAPTFRWAERAFERLGDAGTGELCRLLVHPTSSVRREAALLLARRGVPEAASTLLRCLSESPSDSEVAQELALLTCLDLRDEPDPARAWWEWWDLVVHDDSLAWFRSSAERAGFSAPSDEALRGAGTRAGALFLLDVAERTEFPLRQRAQREFARLCGVSVDALGPAAEASVMKEECLARIEEIYGEN